MYFNDHGEPHFHVRYGEYTAKISIDSLQIIRGALPRRAYHLATEWAETHREELMENWRLTQTGHPAFDIAPLT